MGFTQHVVNTLLSKTQPDMAFDPHLVLVLSGPKFNFWKTFQLFRAVLRLLTKNDTFHKMLSAWVKRLQRSTNKEATQPTIPVLFLSMCAAVGYKFPREI